MATLAMPMSAVPASIQDLPIPIEDLQAQVNELSAQKQEVPAAIQESSATVQDVHKLTEEKSNSNRATTTPTEETTSSAEETPTLTAEKIDLAEGNTVSTDDTLAQVQEIPIAVQVPAKHDVETATAALDTSLDSLPPPKVAVPAIKPPSSYFKPNHHPRMQDVSQEVDGYFLEHWPFKDEKARKKFVGAGFSRVTCLYFPEALDDRIHFACRLLTVLFLVDDLLEDMSFEEGEAYNEKLIPISRGNVLPDRSIPVEYITYDLWESMRAYDRKLADEILEPVFTFMRAQTDRTRVGIKELGPYLEYRERDVGKALLSALMRFSMGLSMTPEELNSVKDVDVNCAKHISVINDIFSWEKELLASRTGHQEGSALCSSVQVLAEEAHLSTEASKRILFNMCREWELCHMELVAKRKREVGEGLREEVMRYMDGLEYQMSGNELWSQSTLRYIGVIAE